jgi:hypothetical protein
MLVLGFAVYGTQVRHGGFLMDDWYIASQYQTPAHPGFGLVRTYMHTYGQRPVSALYLLAAQAVFGLHSSIFLAWSVVLAASMSTLLFIVLRQLGLERIHAGAIAALVLVFPTADSTVLWVAGSNAHLNISLFLAGLIVALHGLRMTGHSARAWHAGALALYALSILFAETTAGPVLLSVFIYRLLVPWRAAARRWAADVVVALAAIAYVGSRTRQPIVSAHAQWDHVVQIVSDAVRIIELAGVTTGQTRIPGPVIVAVVALGAMAWFVLPKGGAIRGELGRWLLVTVAGVAALAAGYLMLVPGSSYYAPSAQGLGNRVNALAAPGYAIVLYSLAAMIACGLLALRSGWVLVTAATAAVAVLLAAFWIGEVRKDQSAYTNAYALAKHSLRVIDHRVPKPPRGTTVYTFGIPKETASVVPVWDASWDLTGALTILWRDRTIFGIPSPTISDVRCTRRAIEPIGSLYPGGRFASTYGRALFVNIATAHVQAITDRKVCEAARHRYVLITIESARSLPPAILGHQYLRRLRATGGTPPYQWQVTNGTLPPGMSLWSTGELMGTPGASGNFHFTVTVLDSGQVRGTQTATYALRVSG